MQGLSKRGEMQLLRKTPNKSLHRTHLSVTPFAEQKSCQPMFAAELNRYASSKWILRNLKEN